MLVILKSSAIQRPVVIWTSLCESERTAALTAITAAPKSPRFTEHLEFATQEGVSFVDRIPVAMLPGRQASPSNVVNFRLAV